MSNSICIKTNNLHTISYILDELEHFNIDNVYFSCKKFKCFTNIIIHYKGKNISLFRSSLSQTLSYLVLDLYENSLIKNLISNDYFYFSSVEQKSVFDMCINNLNYENSFNRFYIIKSCFDEYFNDNKTINLNGFINFRLYNYFQYLSNIVDLCVNKFIIDKEYSEFVNLLRTYVFSSESKSETVHLIYKNKDSILLDEAKNIIPTNSDIFKAHYLSDISFSSNDYALNTLLTILPQNLYVHLIDEEDEFINTLKLIFEKRVNICSDCNICSLYQRNNIKTKK